MRPEEVSCAWQPNQVKPLITNLILQEMHWMRGYSGSPVLPKLLHLLHNGAVWVKVTGTTQNHKMHSRICPI